MVWGSNPTPPVLDEPITTNLEQLPQVIKTEKGSTAKGEWCPTSLEENKTIIRRFFEAVNKSARYTLQRRGRKDLKQFLTFLFKTFPDWHEITEDIIAEGDKVWIRVKYTATHKGEWRGSLPLMPKRNYVLPPTGKKITFTVSISIGSWIAKL